MQAKSILGTIGWLLPVLYCGGLVYYFVFEIGGGSLSFVSMLGLGPTVWGLAAIGLLFALGLAVKIARLAGETSGGSPSADTPGGRRPSAPDDDSFDPDAVVARYLASQAMQGQANAASPAPGRMSGTAPPSFGRRRR